MRWGCQYSCNHFLCTYSYYLRFAVEFSWQSSARFIILYLFPLCCASPISSSGVAAKTPQLGQLCSAVPCDSLLEAVSHAGYTGAPQPYFLETARVARRTVMPESYANKASSQENWWWLMQWPWKPYTVMCGHSGNLSYQCLSQKLGLEETFRITQPQPLHCGKQTFH